MLEYDEEWPEERVGRDDNERELGRW